MNQTHRYLTIPHSMKKIEPVITGKYLNSETQKQSISASLNIDFTPSIIKGLNIVTNLQVYSFLASANKFDLYSSSNFLRIDFCFSASPY